VDFQVILTIQISTVAQAVIVMYGLEMT